MIPTDKALILFDGVCNLCNSSVLFVIKHDKTNRFLFAPLQSPIGEQIMDTHQVNPLTTDSVLLYQPKTNTIKVKSSAALHIARHLGFPLNLLTVFLIIPSFIRNWIYDFVARNRYKWFGRKEACMVPTPELTTKFIT